jgi:hypothetical protein
MILYKLITQQSLTARDIQTMLEYLKSRKIDAFFEGFECIKVGEKLPFIE